MHALCAAQVGANQAPSNVNNITAVLFLWTILPGYAAASYMPTIVLERPLYVRCAHQLHGLFKHSASFTPTIRVARFQQHPSVVLGDGPVRCA